MKNHIKNLTLSAMFLALGLVLPFLTGQIPQIGSMLLPMHIPVFLCGLICGWQYGAAVGLITPLLRSVLFGMPPLYPTAVAMAAELLTYGLVVGLMYSRSRWIGGEAFTWEAFMAGAFLNAIPGIIIQLILIPAIMVALNRTGLVRFKKKPKEPETANMT